MFLCDTCHAKDCPEAFLEGLMRSRGPCEHCKQVSACYDCHGYKREAGTPPSEHHTWEVPVTVHITKKIRVSGTDLTTVSEKVQEAANELLREVGLSTDKETTLEVGVFTEVKGD